MSESCASRSTILPLPSSPHCAPTMTVAGTYVSLGRGLGCRCRAFDPLDPHLMTAPAEERAVVEVELQAAGERRAREAFGRVQRCARLADGGERDGRRGDLDHLFARAHAAARSANFA